MYTDAPRCPSCTRVLDDRFIDRNFALPQRRFAISTTYDGCLIASKAFQALCEPLSGLTFVPLRSEPEYAALWVEQTVHVDAAANGTRLGDLCDECGLPRYVIGPGRSVLASGEMLPHGLSRTNLGYGDTADFGPQQPNHLGPVILADPETAAMLNASGLPGVHFIPIE